MSYMSKFCVCIFLHYLAAVLIILPLLYAGLLGGKDCEEYECWINLLLIMFGMFASLVFLCVCCCLAAYCQPSEPDIANRIVFRSPDDATLNSPPDKSQEKSEKNGFLANHEQLNLTAKGKAKVLETNQIQWLICKQPE